MRLGRIISPWLYNLYTDGVMRVMNARVMGRVVRLDHNLPQLESEPANVCNKVLVADLEKRLLRIVCVWRGVSEEGNNGE